MIVTQMFPVVSQILRLDDSGFPETWKPEIVMCEPGSAWLSLTRA